MALIGTIRKNGWILIVLMILALGGFILMDVVSNAQRYRAGDINSLGKVNGQEIKRSEFDKYEKLIFANSKGNTFQVRQQIWNYFVENALVSKEAEALGLGVGKDELLDLQFGNNLSPVIVERFKGEDGQPNRTQLSNIKAAIDQRAFANGENREFWEYWAVQEKEVIKERLQEKVSNLVLKSVYTPLWQAEMTFKENNERIDFNFVRIPYDKVPDADVKLTDADYEAYLKDNPNLHFQPEETRQITYVSIDVFPTSADSAAAHDAAIRFEEGLRSAPNDSTYLVSNNGKIDDGFKRKSALPANIADTLLKLPLGTIVGPFEADGAWTVAKIMDRKLIPDSVRARHILLRQATPDNEKKIDSLMAILNAKTVPFDTLAKQNSADGSAAKGGDLGWFGEGNMVAEFNNVCFYQAEQGKYYKVATQFGWHLIEVTGKKFIKNESGVKAAYLSQPIEPSTQTQQLTKDKALALVQQAKNLEDLTSRAGQQGLNVQTSPPLKANDYSLGMMGSGEDAREIVRWAFEEKTKVGDIGKEVFSFRDPKGGYFDSKYMVAALKNIAPKGKCTIATLKATPRAENDIKNRKKAEIIKGKLQNAGDLDAVASQWGVPVDTARGSSLMQPFIPNGGSEPRVVGAAFSLSKDAVSAPIGGTAGVYIVKLTSEKTPMPAPSDLTLFRRQVTSSTVSSLKMALMVSWKRFADTKDNRSRFF